MKLLKIFLLSSVFVFSNCSLMNDKFFSKSDKSLDKNSDEQEISKVSKDKYEDEELATERIYIEDDKNVKGDQKEEGLQGDTEERLEYPNLANVPNRPDSAISIEEQESIIKDLENNSQLEPIPSETIIENRVSNLETGFNDTNEIKSKNKYYKSKEENINSIRNILDTKLAMIENFKPDPSSSETPQTSKEEEELHILAKELKNMDTLEQVNKAEEKIRNNNLYYTPDDIEKILGLKSVNKKENNKKKVLANKKDITKEKDVSETTIIEKKIEVREVPVARITFNHGSSNLTNTDLMKIKKVANLFFENQGSKILIVGHASSRTNYDMDLTKHALVNFNISLERARTVMKEFSTIGLSSQKIELVAMSDANPLYAEIMPRLEAANRRAEIFIQY